MGGGGEEGGGLSAAHAAQVRQEYTRLRKAYLDRRRSCMEVLGNLGESKGCTEKQLMEELGLETDQECGVDKKNFPPLTA